MKNSFILYTDYFEYIKDLDDKQSKQLLHAIFLFELGEELPEMDGIVKMAFSFIRGQLERDGDKWDEISRKRSEAGKKGGIASAQKRANEAKASKRSNVKHNVTVNVNDNVNVNDKEHIRAREPKHKYGEFENVKLTDRERDRLFDNYGESETLEAIRFLDEYKERKGYKSRDDNLTLRKWVFDAVNEERQKRTRGSNVIDWGAL